MFKALLTIVVICVLVGCGNAPPSQFAEAVPATGIVRLDGKPLSNSMIAFIPKPGTKALESYGVTDEDGSFSLRQPRGGSGAVPGEYSVVINRYVLRDGTPVELKPNEFPANQGAIESLPPKYSDPTKTSLSANVPEDGGEFEFDLKLTP